jgi:DNA-binding NarL/FixJ family response regulator
VRDAVCNFILRTCDSVCQADDGVAAIAKAKECPTDLVIMDLNLPRLNGVQAASELRRMLPGIKIIGFTALRRKSAEELLGETKFDALLSKHDGLTKLAEAIETLLPRR